MGGPVDTRRQFTRGAASDSPPVQQCKASLTDRSLFLLYLSSKSRKSSPIWWWVSCNVSFIFIRRLHYGLSYHEGCWLLILSVPRIQKGSSIALKPDLVDYIYLHLLVAPKGYFCAITRHNESFPSAYQSSRWSYSCFEQQPLHLRVHCGFREFSEQGRYAVRKGFSYNFVHLQVQHICVGPVSFSRCSCRPAGGDRLTVLRPF